MKKNGLIDEYSFSLYLSNKSNDSESRLIFGGIDESYIMKGIKKLN